MKYVVGEHLRTYTVRDIDTQETSVIESAEYYNGVENGSIIGKETSLAMTVSYIGVKEDNLDAYYIKRSVLIGGLELKEICRCLQTSVQDTTKNVAVSSDLSHIVYKLETNISEVQYLLEYLKGQGYVRFDIFLYSYLYDKNFAYIRFNLPKFCIKELRRELNNGGTVTEKEQSGACFSFPVRKSLSGIYSNAAMRDFSSKDVTLNCSGLVFDVDLALVEPEITEEIT